MPLNFKIRSPELEIMDDFNLSGLLLRDSLDKIAGINQWLGGNKITLQGISKLLPKNKKETITILDIGCGAGHLCRKIAVYLKKKGVKANIIGIDANADAIEYAKELTKNDDSITYKTLNVFSNEFKNIDFDIATTTLTLHHFIEEDLLKLLQLLYTKATIGIVVNDLHRSRVAYRLFQLVCTVFGLNKMVKNDGCISILSAFKKRDFLQYAKQLNFTAYKLTWRWAFRYLWIIRKI